MHRSIQPCTLACAQTYASLGAGNWTFSVRSIDGAGNVESVTVPFYTWTLALTAGYPIISGGDSGTTAKCVPAAEPHATDACAGWLRIGRDDGGRQMVGC